MDIKNKSSLNINLDEYNFAIPSEIKICSQQNNSNFIDIEVEDNHSYFLYSKNDDCYILSHNCDGSHITGLYIGFFSRFFKSIIQSGRLCRLKTPIMALMKNSEQIHKMFFSLDEYSDYIKNHDCKKYSIQYFKGLGTWTPELFEQVFKTYSLDDLIVPFEYDENAANLIDNWLNSKKADERKEMLRNNEFDIFGI